MIRSLLALILLSFLASDASACGARAGLFRGRVREHTRIVHRERHVQRGSCASGVVVVPVSVVPCPAGKCPMKK